MIRPLEPLDEPPALHDKAIDNLRFIRETMERAGSFTAVPGWGQVCIGTTALAAALLASRQSSAERWLATWIGEALLAVTMAGWTMARKARAANTPLLSGPGRKFWFSFSLPLFVGALLTVVLYRAGMTGILPGTWILMFGTGVVTGGVFSIRIIPVMGLCFMALGALALFSPSAWGDAYMAGSFGALQIVFGAFIAWRYGG